MHIVIVSAPRTGSHMLRSMLKADPRIADIGAFLMAREGLIPMPTAFGFDTIKGVYQDQVAAHPDRVVLSNLKTLNGAVNIDHVRAAGETGGRFVFLMRRDYVAQIASLALANQYLCFYRPAPEGATVMLDPERVAQQRAQIALGLGAVRGAIVTFPHVEIVYEDLTPDTVAAAMKQLTGLDLTVGAPTTPKIAPPLETYVTNLSELRR